MSFSFPSPLRMLVLYRRYWLRCYILVVNVSEYQWCQRDERFGGFVFLRLNLSN